MSKAQDALGAGSRMICTKLAPPRQSRHVVPRNDLLRTLALSSERALTVLRAPAGFGKTTVLTEWRRRLMEDGQFVAWLTLDAEDGDPAQFLIYLRKALSLALDRLAEPIPELSWNAENASPRVIATSLINAIESIDREITLILDDYDRISMGPIHDLLSFLIMHAPAQLHVVIATRTEPALPLADLRAHDELVEIDATNMRFGIEHTRRFFAEVASLNLSAGQTRALHDATEGWVAGLQIAAIGLRGREDPDSLIESFSGNYRAVNEYLAQAVLPSISPDTLDFMLRTSILDRLSGPLCDFVAGCTNGQETLERLLSQNLFLQALDDESRWYRHHALFADFLRGSLERRMPLEIAELHIRAAEWFAQHELWSEAVRHALAANNAELATEWVERCAMREVENSHVRRLLAWAAKLPDEEVRKRPRLRIALAWALLLTMQLDDAQAMVKDIAENLTRQTIDSKDRIEAELLGLRFCITALKDDTAAAQHLGEQFLALPRTIAGTGNGGTDTWLVQAVLNGLTHCYQKAGQIDRARALHEPDLYPTEQDRARNLFTMGYRACTLGACDVYEGRLEEGAQKFRDALAIAETHAGRHSAVATLIACALSEVLYEWNKLDDVEQLLADRLDVIDDTAYLDSVRAAYLALVRLAVMRGDFESAHNLLNRAENLGGRRGWPRLLVICMAERLSIFLLQGKEQNAASAMRRIERLVPDSPPDQLCAASESYRVRTLASARWLLHVNHAEDAVRLLKRLDSESLTGATPYVLARARMLLAIALDQVGQREEAIGLLATIVDNNRMSTSIRCIADEGAAAAQLVQALAQSQDWATSQKDRSYRLQLLRAMNLPDSIMGAVQAAPSLPVNPVEPLSERERDVLRLIAQGLSNKQTASALMLGTETVKWHLKNVFGKLGVSRRTLAVYRARQLNLLPPSAAMDAQCAPISRFARPVTRSSGNQKLPSASRS